MRDAGEPREDDHRIVPRDPGEFAKGLPIILDALDGVEGASPVKVAVGERHGADPAKPCEAAAGLQKGESRLADVEEGRAGNGKSRV